VALAGVDMNVSVSVLTTAMDDILSVEGVVLVEWLVGPKAVSINCE
jgi:hypothetical protein